MSDQYDDMPPADDEADDFKNFDPEAYLAKRGRSRTSISSDIERDVQDAGGRGSRSSRRQRYSDEGDAGNAAQNMPLGIGAAILGLLQNGNIGITAELLRSFGPIAKIALGILGCAFVFFCVIVCGGGFVIINAFTHR